MSKDELGDKLDELKNIDNIDYTEILGKDARQLLANVRYNDSTSLLFRIEFNGNDLPKQRKRLYNILEDYNRTEVAY